MKKKKKKIIKIAYETTQNAVIWTRFICDRDGKNEKKKLYYGNR